MSKSAKSEGRKKAADRGQLWLRLPGLVREALYETVIGAGLACVDEAVGGACWHLHVLPPSPASLAREFLTTAGSHTQILARD